MVGLVTDRIDTPWYLLLLPLWVLEPSAVPGRALERAPMIPWRLRDEAVTCELLFGDYSYDTEPRICIGTRITAGSLGGLLLEVFLADDYSRMVCFSFQ